MKTFKSRYFEDYKLDETILHSVPRTITEGDVSIYLATTGSRFAINYSLEFSKSSDKILHKQGFYGLIGNYAFYAPKKHPFIKF